MQKQTPYIKDNSLIAPICVVNMTGKVQDKFETSQESQKIKALDDL